MKLQKIKNTELHVSPLNQRAKADPDISDILPSVREFGVLQTLAVHVNDSGYGVLAGCRRLKAGNTVAAEIGEPIELPCAIMDLDDEADMRAISMLENFARQDPDPMTEFETFAALVKDGRAVADVAILFGMSERAVNQRLALGNLKPAIRKLYREEEISHETAKYLTMASARQQTEWLKLRKDNRAPNGWQLKSWLFDGQSISVDVAVFDWTQFKGKTITDLFGEDEYFADSNEFWKHQNQGISALVEAHEAAGWSEVVLLETGYRFSTWDHEAKTKNKGGRVYVQVDYDGSVTIHAGYVTKKEAERAKKIANGETPEPEDAPKVRAELTQAAQTYINLHRHNAVRVAVADDPKTALRLMVAHAIGGSGLWRVEPDTRYEVNAHDEDFAESVTGSKDAQAFEKKRQKVLRMLKLDRSHVVDRYSGETHTAEIFAALRKMTDAKVMEVLAVVMAETLSHGSGMAEITGELLEVDMSKTYTPDNVFFGLIKDKAVLGAMLEEVAGKDVAESNLTATGKVKKGIVRDCLDGTNGRDKVAAWTPGYFAFPFRAYDRFDGIEAQARRNSVAEAFGN